MFTEEDYKVINRELETLKMSSLKRCANQEEFELVLKAFDFANEVHKGVRRRSGEPYILHPIAVARIVVQEIGLGYKSICAALLHDVVEDTNYTVEDIKNHFGQKIASLVDGLTKIKTALDSDNITYSKSMQAENFKRILLTLNDDVRIVLIKLADRLHNMRTIGSCPNTKGIRSSVRQCISSFRLHTVSGLYSIKSEMENIWLVHREPEATGDRAKLETVMEERAGSIDSFVVPIEKSWRQSGTKLRYSNVSRLPTPSGKDDLKNVPFEQIFDIYAVRIIFEAKQGLSEREQCWQIFSLITERYQYKPDRTRDWVKEPKSNGYEALHLTVMGPGGKWIEVQIRSERMNSIAERGVAAHWMYKKGESSPSEEGEIDLWLKHVRDILEDPDSNALQFLDNFHKELLSSDIYIFTPKGESKTLPKGSTALDFAYIIHSEVGNRAIAAKVNQKLLPLSHVLSSGDQVEIITSDSSKPKREWLDFIRTNRARNFILDSIKAETKDSIKEGMRFLTSKLKERNITSKSRVLKKLIDYYKAGSKDELYHKIGIGLIDLSDLETALKTNVEKRNVQMWGVKLLASSQHRQN